MKNDKTIELEVWIPKCRKNNRQAQEMIYRHYFRSMFLLVRRYTRDEDTIMSIVNDGFLKIFNKIEKYDFTGSFEGWCKTIMFRSVSDHFRKKKNNFKLIQINDGEEITQNEGLSDLYYEDAFKSLDQLPETTRKVFELYALQGYKHKEIAVLMGMSEGTSKWHVSHARSTMQEFLTKRNKLGYGG